MRYKLTDGTQNRLHDLLRLIRETRPFLGSATPAIRAEWDTIRARFPSEDDARQGYTSLSELEIEELRARIARFRPERRPSAIVPVAQLVPLSSTSWQPTSLAAS
jgi:hypothetical protein